MNDTTATRSLFERVANHDRLLVTASLALAAALGLWATLHTGTALMRMSSPAPGTVAYAGLLFVMWWTMMMAMMLPSAAPAILTYAAMSRRFAQQGVPQAPVAVFVAGYAAVWTLFSLAAVNLQIVTRSLIPLSMMMALVSGMIGGSLLIAAGVYQLTPLKYACLRHCQSPLMFFARNWRKGWGGAFRMGVSHGTYCLGCCWVLMSLLFYGGVMELTWIVGLAAYVAAEKLIPANTQMARFAGMILVIWGLWTLYFALS